MRYQNITRTILQASEYQLPPLASSIYSCDGPGGYFTTLKKIEHVIVWVPVVAALSFAAWQTYDAYAADQVKIEASRQKDLAAQQAGFLNDRDRQEAAASGITDAVTWKSSRAEIERKAAEAKAKADSERAQRIENERKTAASAAARLAEENMPPATRMDISRQSWKTGGFGSVGIMTFTLSNANSYAVKDFVVSCSFYGNSGTLLGLRQHTVYETLKPKSKRTFRDVNIGFIPNQSSRGGCDIVSAVKQ